MLDQITPVILTYNESLNIRRTLSKLGWAKDIVVVDSGSSDDTISILREFPNVRLFDRAFDSHGRQWGYATQQTAIATPWLLRLDADYVLSDALVHELQSLDANEPVSAYRIGFDYAVYSRPLASTLYPANTILLRQGRFTVRDNGHTEAWSVDGAVRTLQSKIVHDDWKRLDRWVASQVRYARLEVDALPQRQSGMEDWLRRHPPLMPIVMFFYCLFRKGLIFDGRAGLFYALQRTMAEMLVSLTLLDDRLREKEKP